jgi:hypothetical protein
MQDPTQPLVSLQVSPPGQLFRLGAVLQPGMQMPAGPEQTSPEVGPPHSESPSVSTQPHRPSGVQMGLTPPHSVVLEPEHSVQAPVSGPVIWQAGRAGSVQLGAPSPVQGPQRCTDGSQNGVEVLPQSALVTQPTHWPRLGSQTGVVPVH